MFCSAPSYGGDEERVSDLFADVVPSGSVSPAVAMPAPTAYGSIGGISSPQGAAVTDDAELDSLLDGLEADAPRKPLFLALFFWLFATVEAIRNC